MHPDTPPTAPQIQGYDSLRGAGPAVLAELQGVYDIFVDAAEFADAALELLNELPNEIMELKLWKNKGIALLFLDLLCWYMRVVMMVSSLEEKKVFVSLFNIAHAAVHNTSDISYPRVVQLINTVETPQNHFIHEFKHKDGVLAPLICQFTDVLTVRMDTDNLKNKNIFNPVDDGDLMGLPAVRPLAPGNEHLSMFTELAEAHKYAEYVIFALLACPIMLYRQECLDLFRLVASESLVVTLYRDLVINIHQEFESITNGSQIKKDTNVARNYKLKPLLKEIAKDAVVRTGCVHRERRTFLRGELANLTNLFALSPGLLGPKFPMVFAIASLARSELLHFFCHVGQEARKDVKKSHSPEDYQPVQVMPLFGELFKLHSLVVKYAKVVQNYFIEYLSECDALAVERLNHSILRADSDSSFAHKVMNNVQLTLAGLVSEEPESCRYLEGLRVDWARFACYFSTNAMHGNAIAKSDEFDNLTKRMNSVVERTHFVDNLDFVYRNYFLPYNLWWFRSHVKELFLLTLGDYGSAQASCEYAPAVLHLPQTVLWACHEDCPEEAASIGESATRFCDACLTDLSAHVERAVVKLWDFYQSLDNMVQPIEAANRLERSQQAKRNASDQPAAQAPLPGYESTFMYRPTIMNLIQVKRNLVEIVAALDFSGTFVVFNREYNLAVFLRKQIYLLLEQRLKRLLFKEDTDIERPSIVLQKIIVGCQAIQDVVTLIDGDSGSITRNILFSSFVSLSLPPPGSPLRTLPQDEGSGSPLIWRIAAWFVRMVDLAATTDSGLVWVVSQKMFARTKNAFPVDMFLNPNDLNALCTLVGSQGVRVINAELLKVITQKVERMKDFVNENANELTEFSKNYFQSMSAAKQLKDLSGFFHDATACGVALAMREV
jgi:NCK-associated protein 1